MLSLFGLLSLATSCEELTPWKRPWCWEGLRAGGEGDDGGWDGCMASLTRWTWVWVNSGSWWWTGRPGVLQVMGLQRVGHDWATELNWTELSTHGQTLTRLLKLETMFMNRVLKIFLPVSSWLPAPEFSHTTPWTFSKWLPTSTTRWLFSPPDCMLWAQVQRGRPKQAGKWRCDPWGESLAAEKSGFVWKHQHNKWHTDLNFLCGV